MGDAIGAREKEKISECSEIGNENQENLCSKNEDRIPQRRSELQHEEKLRNLFIKLFLMT